MTDKLQTDGQSSVQSLFLMSLGVFTQAYWSVLPLTAIQTIWLVSVL